MKTQKQHISVHFILHYNSQKRQICPLMIIYTVKDASRRKEKLVSIAETLFA